jgi:hypothetical protein
LDLKENNILQIKIHDNESSAKNSIKQHIIEKKMRKKEKNELCKTFTNIINYDINQWKKYDLLVSQGNKINVLTVITKKIVRKYVTIYLQVWQNYNIHIKTLF